MLIKTIKVIRSGSTRWVIPLGNFVIKIPSLYSWKNFLWGLLANLQESEFNNLKWQELCPVIFSAPLGLFLISKRARMMTEEEFSQFDSTRFINQSDGRVLPVEEKASSFGFIDGQIVAVDYGS